MKATERVEYPLHRSALGRSPIVEPQNNSFIMRKYFKSQIGRREIKKGLTKRRRRRRGGVKEEEKLGGNLVATRPLHVVSALSNSHIQQCRLHKGRMLRFSNYECAFLYSERDFVEGCLISCLHLMCRLPIVAFFLLLLMCYLLISEIFFSCARMACDVSVKVLLLQLAL